MFLPILLVGLQGLSVLRSEASGQQARTAQSASKDLSDYLGILLAADFAGGVDSSHRHASMFAGIKIGMPVGLKAGLPPSLLRTLTLDVG